MPLITKAVSLIAALVEHLLSGRGAEVLAHQLNLAPSDLRETLAAAVPYSWRGKLEAALANPAANSERLAQLQELASLEFQYQELQRQYLRAEQSCALVRAEIEPNLNRIMKADAFSFRIQQAACRILQKISTAAAKLAKNRAEQDQNNRPAKPVESPELGVAPNQAENAPPQKTHSAFVTPSAFEPLAAVTQVTAAKTNSIPVADEAILKSHRHQIRNAPPHKRAGLIAQLLQKPAA